MLKLLEYLGRKSVMVDFYGRVLMERYHLGWYEQEEKGRIWPNLWLHHFPGPNSPDSKDDAHKHPYSTIGFVLRGGYVEIVNRALSRAIDRWHPAILSYKDNHRIASVVPGTWTLFFHGFRRQPWTFEFQKCEVVCDACKESRAGFCYKEEHPVMEWAELFAMSRNDVRWIQVNKDTAMKLARRRQAVSRKGLVVPTSKAEVGELFKAKIAAKESRVA